MSSYDDYLKFKKENGAPSPAGGAKLSVLTPYEQYLQKKEKENAQGSFVSPGSSTLPGGQSSHETGASGNDSAGNSDGASSTAGNMIAPGYYLDTNTGIAPAQTDRTPTFVTHSATPHVISTQAPASPTIQDLEKDALAKAQKAAAYVREVEYWRERVNGINALMYSKRGRVPDSERAILAWTAKTYGNFDDTLAEAKLAAQNAQDEYVRVNAISKAVSAADFSEKSKYHGDTEADTLIARVNKNLYLENEETAVFNYLWNTEGEAAAKQYLDTLEDLVNQRKGQARANDAQGNYLKQLGIKAEAGFNQFTSGFGGLFSNEAKNPSVIQYASAAVDEDLEDVDLKWYDFAEGEWKDQKIFGRSLGQAGGDLVQTATNMLPSIGASALAELVVPGSGSAVGLGLMGTSSAGNARQEMLNQGYSQGTANAYGILTGSSEIVLGKVLGGISKLGGGGLTRKATAALSKMDNALSKFAKSSGGKLLMNAGSEAMEEGLQSVLEPYIKAAVTDEDFTVDMEEAMYSALMGFVSGGIFEGAGSKADAKDSGSAPSVPSSALGIVPEGVRDLLNMTGSGKTDAKTDWKTALEELEPDDTQETVRPDIPVENRVLGPWISAAVDYYGKNGKLHPSDVEYILDDGKSRQMLTDLTGIEIPAEGDAARQQAVEQAVSTLAGQSGQQLISGAKHTWYDMDQAAGPQAVNPMVEDLINNLPASNAEAATAQSQSRQDLQEIIDAQLSPNQNDPAPIDTTQNSVYDDINNPQGGHIYEQTDTDSTHSARLLGTNNEFARVQAESRGTSFENIRQRKLDTRNNESVRTRLSAALAGELERRGYRHGNADGLHLTSGRGQTFEILTVDASTFHDVFEVARKYTRNGELVDLHSVETTEDGIGYEDCENYLSADGMSGFSITPDGDLISVFNADASKKGFLRAIAPVVKSKVKTLDCYMSQHQPLHEIYEKAFGMKVASVMDHNMDYDRDGIAANHNRPKVAFMVNTDRTVEPAFFSKDDYDAAKAYRDSLLDDSPTDLTTQPPSGPTDVGPAMPHAPGGSKVSELYSNTYANATGEATQAIGQRAQELDPNIATYDPVTEKESFDEAISRADSPEARSAEIDKLLSKDGWTGADNDTAYVILDKLRQEGDAVRFAALANKQRQMNTTAGQLVQSNAKYSRENLTKRTIDAFNTLSDMTERDVPQKYWKDQGFEAWKQQVGSTILDISNKLEQAAESGSVEDVRQIIRSLAQFRRTTAWFGLSSNLTKIAERGLKHIDADTAKAMAMAQLSQIPGDFQKRPIGQVIETIRVHNMLAALTTVNRNLFGNGVVGLVDATSDSTVGRGMDMILSKFTGKRTVGNDLTHGKTYLDAAGKAASIAALCVELDIPMDSDSRFTEGSTRTFSPRGGPVTRLLGAYEKAMKYALEVTDQFFSGGTAGAVDLSLQKLGDKANLTDAERQELAGQTGLRRTFKEDRMLSRMAAKAKQALNEAKLTEGLALGNAIMPLVRTGSNVTQTGADYTGAGLAVGFKEAIQLIRDVKSGAYKNGVKIDPKTGKKTTLAQAQRRAATNMGRGLTGVGTISLFTAAALCGALRVHDDEDRDAKALDQSGNLSGAQLNLSALLRGFTGESTDWQNDDCVISMDFLEPFNSQMYLGYALSREEGMKDILKAYPGATFSSIWQAARDMPMMQGLSDAVDLAGEGEFSEAFGQFAGDYATGFMPSWMRQSAQMIDPYYRDTTGENVWDKAGKQLVSRIPFLSQTLPKKVDGLGREQTRHDGDFMGFLNTFVNPGEIEHIKTGELEGFIDGVAQASGDVAVYPRSTLPEQLTYKDENGDKHTYTLTGHDRETYQKTYGENVTRIYSELMDMEYFATLDPDDQATVMRNALDYISDLSESSVADWHKEPQYITERPEGMSEAEAIVRNTLLGSSTDYAEFPIDTAVYVKTLVDAITPETKPDGTPYDNVRPIQKMEAVLADESLEAYADALLRKYLDDGPEQRYDMALDAGFTDDQFIEAYRKNMDTKDKDTKGKGAKQSVILYIQREMGMSYVQAKRLYEILNKNLEDLPD